MQSRTGVARLALTTDAVVVPVAQWGPQRLHDYHRKKLRPRLRAPAEYLVGEPVDLVALRAAVRAGRPLTAELLRETTDLIMSRVRDQLGRAARRARAARRFHPRPAASCPATCRGARRDPRRGAGAPGSWGTTFAKVLADAGCEVMLHARRPELVKAITDERENRRLPARASGCRRRCARRPTRPRRWTAPRSWCWPSPRSRCARTSAAGRRCCRPTPRCSRLMKGIELGTTKRMSEVICEVTGAGPDRVAVALRAEPGPGDRRGAAGRDRDRLRRHRPGRGAAGGLPHARTSGPTRTPTWSAASSAARSRTSSRWPPASPRAWGSATTPGPR